MKERKTELDCTAYGKGKEGAAQASLEALFVQVAGGRKSVEGFFSSGYGSRLVAHE